MKNLLAILLLLCFALPAHAQSTAEPVTPGFLTNSGCPGSQLSCFKPYSVANPLPVTGGGVITNAICTLAPTTCGTFFGYSNPLWYGATGLDNHDDSFAIDAAATAACSGGWKRVGFTYGTYLVLNQHASKCSGETFFALPQNAAYDGNNLHAAITIHVNNGFVAGWTSTNNCYYDQAGFVDQVTDGINYHADGGSLGTVNFCNSHNTGGGDQTPRIYLRNGSSSGFGGTAGGSLTTTGISGNAACFTGTGTTKNNLMTVRMVNWKGEENALGVGCGNLFDLSIDFNSEFAGNACGVLVGTLSGTGGVVSDAFRSEENGYGGISGMCATAGPTYEITGKYSIINTEFQNNNGVDVLFDNACGNDSVLGGYSADGHAGVQGAESAIAFNASCTGNISLNGFVGSVDAAIGQTASKYFVENISGTNTISVIGGNVDSSQYSIARDNVVAGSLTYSQMLTLGQNNAFSASSYLNWGANTGTTGYGIRDNGGTIEIKNSGGSWSAPSSGVSVTASSNNIVINPTPGVSTFTVGATNPINAQGTASTYTIQASDLGETVTHAKATAVAVTLPQAGTGSFTAGASYTEVNLGSGLVTITPTTSTINGAATLVLNNGMSAYVTSDGINYTAFFGPSNFGVVSTGTKFTTSGGGCTVTATTGGATAGTFTTSTTGTCTTTVTMGGATGVTAPNGWFCSVEDLTTVPALFTGLMRQTSSTSTTAVFTGTTVASDVIGFTCTGY